MNKLFTVVGAAAVLVALLGPSTAADDRLKRGEELLQRDCARCHAIGKTGTSHIKRRRRSASWASAIRSNRWKRHWPRASFPVTLTCRNSDMIPKTSVPSLPI